MTAVKGLIRLCDGEQLKVVQLKCKINFNNLETNHTLAETFI
jgi:hypothetical protein